MESTPRRSRASALLAVLTAVALLATLLVAPLAPAQAASATARVRGAVVQAGGGPAPKVKMLWFTSDWTYLGARMVKGGGYSLLLQPGRYFLQFVDQRPSYDVTKNRPSTVSVRVAAGRTTVKNVKMFRGASIGGAVKTGGSPAGGARVVAANTDEQSFETTADSQGRFALGGLPPGNYSIFTYDRKKMWVGKSTYLPRVKGSAFRSVNISLTRRAGSLLVDLYTRDKPYSGTAFVTAVSGSTGQFWTAKAVRGSVTFRGLVPGRYRIKVPGLGNYLPATVAVKSEVRSSRVAFGSVRLTKRGGWITGRAVDKNDPSQGLEDAVVRLLDADGAEVASTVAGNDGAFVLDGQLTTQTGMTVVAGPGPFTPYLGQGTSYCKYGRGRATGVAVRTGERTALGALALPHLADSEQDGVQCWTPATSRTNGPTARTLVP